MRPPASATAVTGLFIALEGGDGSGKSTQARLLVDWLRGQGHDVVETRQPGGTEVGRQIRRILLDPATGHVDARAEALLYAADKAHHVAEVVRPALQRGAVVVSDRYVDSMLAYQGAGRVLDLSEVEEIARWATADLRPDLTIVLDVSPSRAVTRIVAKDRLERAGNDFHERVRQGFLDLAARDPQRYFVTPGLQGKEQTALLIRDRVLAKLSGPGVRLGP